MGFVYLFIGILFLFNPVLRTLDFLPDVIGCLLIIAGMSKLAALDDRLESARKYIYYLTALSAVKLPLSLYLAVEAKKYLLPGSFVFSVLEVLLMIGFFVSLFGGMEYLLSRDSENALHLKHSESASIVCFIFSIARGVGSFAPELLALGEQSDSFDYSYRPTPEQNAALIKPYAELFCFVVILIFGIYCAVICGKYLLALNCDKDFKDKLLDRYNKHVLDNSATYTYRRTRLALIVIFVGLLLLHNQILDFVNILPNVLSFVVLAVGILLLTKCESERSYKLLAFFIPLVPLSLYNNYMQYKLLSETDIDIMGKLMTLRNIPVLLQSTEALPRLSAYIIAEYLLIAIFLFFILKKVLKLPALYGDDTISIFAVILGISGIAYLASCALIYILPFMRTAYSFVSNDINIYIHYDSILGICEWTSIISFIIMLYSAYKFGNDVLFTIKADKKI